METRTDWRQFRKHTHLASADIEIMALEGKPLIFNVKEVKREYGTDVNGSKMDGEFCYFKEDIKPLKLNTANKNQLSIFAVNNGVKREDRHVIERWKDLKIELFVDTNVKLKGVVTDGIRIKPIQPKVKEKLVFTDANFEKAKAAKATIEQIEKGYTITKEIKEKWLIYNK